MGIPFLVVIANLLTGVPNPVLPGVAEGMCPAGIASDYRGTTSRVQFIQSNLRELFPQLISATSAGKSTCI